MALSEIQLRELTGSVVRCQCLWKQDTWHLILQSLPDQIGATIAQAGSTQEQCYQALKRCNEYASGMEALFTAIHFHEKASNNMQALWLQLAAMGVSDELIPKKFVAEFLAFSCRASVDGRDAANAYNAVLSAFAHRDYFGLPSIEEAGLWQSFFRLCDLPPQGPQREYLALGFLKTLAECPKIVKHRRWFLQWVAKVQKALHGERPPPEGLLEAGAPSRPPHVLIDLQPKTTPSAPTFNAVAHVWRDSKKALPPIESFDGSEAEVAEKLDRWIAAHFPPDDQPERIEVFLPCEWLFKTRPHAWPTLQDADIPSRLGLDYPTVVRLDRRARPGKRPIDPRFISKWKKNWKSFKAFLAKTANPETCALCVEKQQVLSPISLLNTCRKSDARPMLIAAFEPETPNGKPGLAQVMLQAGTPAAVWGAVQKEEILKLLNGGALASLPEALLDFRLESGDDGPGARISLLWDNPNRCLPDVSDAPEVAELTDEGLIGPES